MLRCFSQHEIQFQRRPLEAYIQFFFIMTKILKFVENLFQTLPNDNT